MRLQGRGRRLLGGWLLFATLTASPGCLSVLHQVEKPLDEVVLRCQELPHCCRSHVHVFIIHGTDPFDWANLHGLNQHLRDLGFPKTHLGQLYHTGHFSREVRRLHQEDPDARFVLIGFSFGANMVRNVAHAAKRDGITIDLLVYLGGNTLDNTPHDRPDNCVKVVNILALGCIWNGTTFDDAENIQLRDVYHFGSPTHPHTISMLERELAVVAANVPIPVETTDRMPTLSLFPEPTPRPEAVTKATARDEWDFLKPAALRPPSTPVQTVRQPAPSGPRGEPVAGR